MNEEVPFEKAIERVKDEFRQFATDNLEQLLSCPISYAETSAIVERAFIDNIVRENFGMPVTEFLKTAILMRTMLRVATSTIYDVRDEARQQSEPQQQGGHFIPHPE